MPYARATRSTRRSTSYRRNYGSRRSYGSRSSKNYGAAQRSKTMVITNSRTSNSANRVGAGGLTRLTTGRFKDMPTLWPDRFMLKMKYVDTVNNTVTITGTGSTFSVLYRINSLYDPLYTTVSEQNVAGFLEMAQMYNNYRVHAAKMTTNIVPNASGTQGALVTSSFSRFNPGLTSSTTYASLLNSIGNPYTVWQLCATQNPQPVNLENFVGMKKLSGSTAYNDNDFASATNTNPTISMYGAISVGVPGPLASGATVTFTMVNEIEWWCEFYGRQFEFT